MLRSTRSTTSSSSTSGPLAATASNSTARVRATNHTTKGSLILSIDMEELDPLAGLGDLEFEV